MRTFHHFEPDTVNGLIPQRGFPRLDFSFPVRHLHSIGKGTLLFKLRGLFLLRKRLREGVLILFMFLDLESRMPWGWGLEGSLWMSPRTGRPVKISRVGGSGPSVTRSRRPSSGAPGGSDGPRGGMDYEGKPPSEEKVEAVFVCAVKGDVPRVREVLLGLFVTLTSRTKARRGPGQRLFGTSSVGVPSPVRVRRGSVAPTRGWWFGSLPALAGRSSPKDRRRGRPSTSRLRLRGPPKGARRRRGVGAKIIGTFFFFFLRKGLAPMNRYGSLITKKPFNLF